MTKFLIKSQRGRISLWPLTPETILEAVAVRSDFFAQKSIEKIDFQRGQENRTSAVT